MKGTTLLMFFFGVIGTCSAQIAPANIVVKLQEGYYAGSDKLFNIVFLKVNKDTAIADFILVEKFPRDLYTDTLVYEGNSFWKGKTTKLYHKKRAHYIASGQRPFESPIKIRPNEALYRKRIDVYKNLAMLNKDQELYLANKGSDEEARKIYEEIEARYEINKLANTLKHSDFLREYEKFKAAFAKE
jgi:hypothetical protein